MQSNVAYAAYNQNNIGIESPQKLFTMLYEGVLRFIYRAKKADKKSEKITKKIGKFSKKLKAYYTKEI